MSIFDWRFCRASRTLTSMGIDLRNQRFWVQWNQCDDDDDTDCDENASGRSTTANHFRLLNASRQEKVIRRISTLYERLLPCPRRDPSEKSSLIGHLRSCNRKMRSSISELEQYANGALGKNRYTDCSESALTVRPWSLRYMLLFLTSSDSPSRSLVSILLSLKTCFEPKQLSLVDLIEQDIVSSLAHHEETPLRTSDYI